MRRRAIRPGKKCPRVYAAGPSRVLTYQGIDPWTHAHVDDITPFAQLGFFNGQSDDVLAPEHWVALVDGHGFGVGLVEPGNLNFAVISGTEGGVPSAYVAGIRPEILDATGVYEYTYTLVVGTVTQIRAYAYTHRPDARPNYVFTHDREDFSESGAGDNGWPIAGAIRLHAGGQLIAPEREWFARQVPRLYIRGAWHTQQRLARIAWRPPGFGNWPSSRPFHVIADGAFRTYQSTSTGRRPTPA